MNLIEKAIDRTTSQKLYCQLLDILRGLIEKSEWKVGAQISTEEQLCSQYNVSKATVRLALAELVAMGYLKKIQGKGTFVRRRKPENKIAMLVNVGEDNLYRNPDCITRIIDNKTLKPDSDIRD
ncbi:MAG: GntR family transcriptional regulator, partial [Nitrospirota bacterium]|nr:GntR family transcriptional regulator [Nitrospirota bacterium]